MDCTAYCRELFAVLAECLDLKEKIIMGCSTGNCGVNWNQNGAPALACCGACAVGAGCDCDPRAIPDRSMPTKTLDAIDPATGTVLPATQAQGVLPPGFWNCEQFADDLAPCDVEKIERMSRRWVGTGDTVAGTLVDVTAVYGTHLPTPVGFSWYRLVVDHIKVSHKACPRSFAVLFDDGNVVVPIAPEDVAIQEESLYQDGNGSFVHAWNWPAPADPDDLKITDNRCACEELCVGVHARGLFGILLLLPTLGVGESYAATVKGIRNCYKISIGDCPPDLLCGREVI
jgi:hypothetical protein